MSNKSLISMTDKLVIKLGEMYRFCEASVKKAPYAWPILLMCLGLITWLVFA